MTTPEGCVQPSIFHITHWKAGSQWIHRILRASVGRELIVSPEIDNPQFLRRSIEPGKVYPTVYVTREQFESITLPHPWRAFVVIRDLRDVLISAYFSFRFSHADIDRRISERRRTLQAMTVENGLLYLLDAWLPLPAAIQKSWIDTSLPLLRYEDLLNDDEALLESTLINHCRLSVGRDRLKQIVAEHRFEKVTGGRPRGREDVLSHERKGVAGDWISYFTPRVAEKFEDRFGDLLELSGYEGRSGWTQSTRLAG